jgi:hypothetical protein
MRIYLNNIGGKRLVRRANDKNYLKAVVAYFDNFTTQWTALGLTGLGSVVSKVTKAQPGYGQYSGNIAGLGAKVMVNGTIHINGTMYSDDEINIYKNETIVYATGSSSGTDFTFNDVTFSVIYGDTIRFGIQPLPGFGGDYYGTTGGSNAPLSIWIVPSGPTPTPTPAPTSTPTPTPGPTNTPTNTPIPPTDTPTPGPTDTPTPVPPTPTPGPTNTPTLTPTATPTPGPAPFNNFNSTWNAVGFTGSGSSGDPYTRTYAQYSGDIGGAQFTVISTGTLRITGLVGEDFGVNIYKQTNGVGSFTSISSSGDNWSGGGGYYILDLTLSVSANDVIQLDDTGNGFSIWGGGLGQPAGALNIWWQ